MARLQLTASLVENKGVIQRRINRALLPEVDKLMKRLANKIVAPVRRLVRDSILSQPEIGSLSGGVLAGEFGFRDGTSRVREIVEIWSNSVEVKRTPTKIINNKIIAGISIGMIEQDYSDVLQSPVAKVITRKGQELPWLEWLLLFGDRSIIRGYDVDFNSGSINRSRSGQAVMKEGQGKMWGVPSEFAGTSEHNFVTRAIDSIDNQLIKIIQTQARSIL